MLLLVALYKYVDGLSEATWMAASTREYCTYRSLRQIFPLLWTGLWQTAITECVMYSIFDGVRRTAGPCSHYICNRRMPVGDVNSVRGGMTWRN